MLKFVQINEQHLKPIIMKPNELRLGNYVLSEISNTRMSKGIVELDSSALMYLFDVDDSWDLINPIQLNEEWFLKFGIEYVTMGIFKLGNFTLIKWSGEDAVFNNFDAVGNKRHCVTLKYVHELQNLYFSITNKELKQK